MSQDIPSVVIDNGTYKCKTGFGGDYEEIEIQEFHLAVAYPKAGLFGKGVNDYFVGDEAVKKKANVKLNYPMRHGVITNWDNMEKIWRYTFYDKLQVAPEEYGVLLTESVGNEKDDRHKMVKIMFEKFNVPRLMVVNQAALSLFDSGRVTGISVNIGHGISQVVPIYEASILNHAAIQWNLSGLELTDYLKRILTERGYRYGDSVSDTRIVNDMKEQLCYVALDFEQEMQTAASSNSLEQSYEQSDGQVITIGNEQFRVPEAMFQPDCFGMEYGVHETTYNSIMKCDEKMRKDMFANIVLSGGSTMFPGFVDRMKKEMCALAPPDTEVNIIDLPNPKYSPWIGGSKVASRPPSVDSWITVQEYKECGPSIVDKKSI